MPEFSEKAGFGISEALPYVIPAGQATAVEAVLDLGRPYAFICIGCPDTSKAQASSNTIGIRVSPGTDGAMMKLNNSDDEARAPQVGSDGTFWRCYFVGAAQRVQLVMSVNQEQDLTFIVLGSDAAAQ